MTQRQGPPAAKKASAHAKPAGRIMKQPLTDRLASLKPPAKASKSKAFFPQECISPATFSQCAKSMRRELQSKNRSHDEKFIQLKWELYSYLNQRAGPDFWLNSPYAEKDTSRGFEAEMNALAMPAGVHPGHGGAKWYVADFSGKTERPEEMVGSCSIIRKEYFTLVPKSEDAEGAYREIMAFVKLLPAICARLSALNSSGLEVLSARIPGSLGHFAKRNDSLIVHYYHSDSRQAIREIVLDACEQAGLQLLRTSKADSGFDLSSPNFKNSNGSLSHSEAIAEIIASHLLENKPQFSKASLSRIASWLEETIASVSAWTPAQAHAALRKIHPEL